MAERFRGKEEEKVLPKNITIAWGRSTVSFGEITYRTDTSPHVRLQNIMREVDRTHTEEEWKKLFDECLEQARLHPTWKYHLVRLDHERFVPENSNNAPFREANGWKKDMEMFGYKYHSGGGKV